MVGDEPALLLLLGIILMLSAGIGSMLLIKRLRLVERGDGISTRISVVAFVYGTMLAFCVMASWQQFTAAQVVVADEASTLGTLYRQTVVVPEPEQTQLKKLLRKYRSEVVDIEWPKYLGGDAASGRDTISDMYRVIGNQPASDASNLARPGFLAQLGQLAGKRDMRVIRAKARVAPLLMMALVFGGLVLMVLMSFVRLESLALHSIVSGAIAILLSLMLYLVYLLNHSFSVDHGITAEPFQRSLAVFDAVDRGA